MVYWLHFFIPSIYWCRYPHVVWSNITGQIYHWGLTQKMNSDWLKEKSSIEKFYIVKTVSTQKH